jgi:hypothetical protein
MYVLVSDDGNYQDNETRVLGIFDSIDTFQSLKETNDPLDYEYWYFYKMQTNTYYSLDDVGCEGGEKSRISVRTLKEAKRIKDLEIDIVAIAAIAEAKRCDQTKRVEEIMARVMTFIQASNATYASACDQLGSPSMPLIVAEYMDELVENIIRLETLNLTRDTDPFYEQKLPKTEKRLDWYMSERRNMRALLVDSEVDSCIIFETVMDITSDIYGLVFLKNGITSKRKSTNDSQPASDLI